MKRTAWIVPAAASLLVGLWAPPSVAAPSDTRVDAVYQLPCAEAVCDAEVDADRLVPDGAGVAKEIQIVARSSATLGFESVRIEARRVNPDDSWDGDWICLKHWGSTDVTTFAEKSDWDSRSWPGSEGNGPGSCPDDPRHGSRTKNGAYGLRVVAVEKSLAKTDVPVTQRDEKSVPVYVAVTNKPSSAPAWASDPVVFGESDREPLVELRWDAVDDPDVAEYRFVREGPDGKQVEFAVSATSPGGQGCHLSGGRYACPDDFFPESGYGGTYSYSLVALRWSAVSTGVKCALPPRDHCVRSSPSDWRTASITEVAAPSPSASGTPSASGDPTPGTTVRSGSHRRSAGGTGSSRSAPAGRGSSSAEFYSGTYDPELPYGPGPFVVPGDGGDVLASGDVLADGTGPIDDRVLLSIATGLILMMFALHMGRLLRDR